MLKALVIPIWQVRHSVAKFSSLVHIVAGFHWNKVMDFESAQSPALSATLTVPFKYILPHSPPNCSLGVIPPTPPSLGFFPNGHVFKFLKLGNLD